MNKGETLQRKRQKKTEEISQKFFFFRKNKITVRQKEATKTIFSKKNAKTKIEN